MRRRPLPTQLTTALDDVQASRAPEVTRVLRPGEARVSRAVGHTIGSCPRQWPSANARPILPSARAQPVPRPRAALPPKEPVPYVEPTADSCSRNRVPSVRHLLLNEARRRRSGPGTRPGGRRARAVGLSGIVGTAFGHACAVCEWNRSGGDSRGHSAVDQMRSESGAIGRTAHGGPVMEPRSPPPCNATLCGADLRPLASGRRTVPDRQ